MRLRRCGVLALLAPLVMAILCTGPAVQAQSITLNNFAPAPLPEDDFALSRPIDQGHMRFGFALHGDYANSPLVIEGTRGDRSREIAELVGHQGNLTMAVSLGLFDRLVLFGGLPVVALMRGADDATIAGLGYSERRDVAGLGNAFVGGRVRLFGDADDMAAMAIQGTVSLPTAGSNQSFRGEDRVMWKPEVSFALRPGIFRVVANVGANLRRNGGTENIKDHHELTFGLGLGLTAYKPDDEPRRHLDLLAQAYGSTAFDDPFGRQGTPVELIAGLKFFHETGFILGAAGGPGLSRGLGSPDARAVVMLAYLTPAEAPVFDSDGDGLMDNVDHCPAQPEDKDDFEDNDGCPDRDDDHDGIEDIADSCRLEPEDKDGFKDGDGCPDPDNDDDGIKDGADRCPDAPEDTDGFEDTDGCPDPDNDGDGILDREDECVDEPGKPANHGCPEPDRDGDGIIDRMDNCPDEPGEARYQGCKAKQKVTIGADRLEILDVVYFKSGSDVIQRRSYPLLMNVADVLNNHPEIKEVLIEGHTDSRGNYKYNVELSKRRAKAVLEFLVNKGEVDRDRLTSEGFGPDRPLVPNAKTSTEHARNRRVEFSFPGTRQ